MGSHGDDYDDADFSFEEEETAAEGGGGRYSPPYSLSRVGAKVRRLNLSGANDQKEDSMDVKKSLARSARKLNDAVAISAFSPPTLDSPARNAWLSGGKRSPKPSVSPRRKTECGDRGMHVCPPSTTKKSCGGVSRLFLDDGDDSPDFDRGAKFDNRFVGQEEEDKDASPRDVLDFPFFAESPPSNKKTGKENYNAGNGNGVFGDVSMAGSNQPESPNSPPSTVKKPLRRMMDLSDTVKLLASPAPPGLRSLGRANSFMQMFSQGSTESGENAEKKRDEDEGEFKLFRPSRQDSAGSVVSAREFLPTVPSPKRPVRGHRNRHLTPASPSKTNNPNQPSSFSRFLSDFQVVGTLGNGAFGDVYSVRNRTDRRLYAIKAAKREARSSSDRHRMLQEVYALSALSDEACEGEMHVLRYHQAWMEGNRLYIQTELCEMTLAEEMRIEGCAAAAVRGGGGGGGPLMGEKRRYKLLREMLLALDLVHKSGMIHLDIKVSWHWNVPLSPRTSELGRVSCSRK